MAQMQMPKRQDIERAQESKNMETSYTLTRSKLSSEMEKSIEREDKHNHIHNEEQEEH